MTGSYSIADLSPMEFLYVFDGDALEGLLALDTAGMLALLKSLMTVYVQVFLHYFISVREFPLKTLRIPISDFNRLFFHYTSLIFFIQFFYSIFLFNFLANEAVPQTGKLRCFKARHGSINCKNRNYSRFGICCCWKNWFARSPWGALLPYITG